MKDFELVGCVFGKLTVSFITREPNARGHDITKCICVCECGGRKEVWKFNLTGGHTKSCGCDKVAAGKARLKHGHAKETNKVSRTYKSWSSMKWRVARPDINVHYVGITVCERWQDFSNFLADMGERPEGKTLDRIDSKGNYEPSNCRWATPKEQSFNRKPWQHTPEGIEAIKRNLPNLKEE